MMRDYVKEKVLARGRKVSIGIDVHKESWQVTATSEGEELFHGRMPGDYSALRKLLNRFVDCQIRVAYEAGCCGFGLYDRLRPDRHQLRYSPDAAVPGGAVDFFHSGALADLPNQRVLPPATADDKNSHECLMTNVS